MQAILGPIMWLSVAGFFASVVVHVLALAGVPSPFGSATWFLHVGIFVVWVPTVLVALRLAKGAKQADFWKATFRGCPAWVRSGSYIVGGYAVINFVLFLVQTSLYARNQVPDRPRVG